MYCTVYSVHLKNSNGFELQGSRGTFCISLRKPRGATQIVGDTDKHHVNRRVCISVRRLRLRILSPCRTRALDILLPWHRCDADFAVAYGPWISPPPHLWYAVIEGELAVEHGE